MDQQTDGRMDREPRFLPRSTPFCWDPGLGSELPVVVIKPLTRRPPRFAAMTFNTSGMIGYLRTRCGRLCWAPGCGSWAPPPEGVPARVGGAGGAAGPDRQAGSPGGGGASRMAQQWAHGEASRTGGSTRSAGRAGRGAGRAAPTRGQGGRAACRGARSCRGCSRRPAGCSGRPRHCRCPHCPARRGQTPCPRRPLLRRTEGPG